jgi:23S rRNA pseudouridine1911/1915/1917 synthase
MNEIYNLIVTEEFEKQRLDKFLTIKTNLSRTRIQELLDLGYVQNLNERSIKANDKVKMGEQYTVVVPNAVDADPVPQNIPLDIIYEDSHLLVLNKPSGFVVHPAPGHGDNTLVNALLHHCKDDLSGIGGVKRPGILHRLDKDTSGIMVVAKNDKAHQGLAQQFHDRSDELKKIYYALVWGRPNPLHGIIDAPIARHPKFRQKMAIINSGKIAQTSYKVLKSFSSKIDSTQQISLVECLLHTGRTHQIRVHMQHIGCPIVGDALYGKGKIKQNLWPDEVYNFKRQALHAFSLNFMHPITLSSVNFEAPLANDIQILLDNLAS